MDLGDFAVQEDMSCELFYIVVQSVVTLVANVEKWDCETKKRCFELVEEVTWSNGCSGIVVPWTHYSHDRLEERPRFWPHNLRSGQRSLAHWALRRHAAWAALFATSPPVDHIHLDFASADPGQFGGKECYFDGRVWYAPQEISLASSLAGPAPPHFTNYVANPDGLSCLDVLIAAGDMSVL